MRCLKEQEYTCDNCKRQCGLGFVNCSIWEPMHDCKTCDMTGCLYWRPKKDWGLDEDLMYDEDAEYEDEDDAE